MFTLTVCAFAKAMLDRPFTAAESVIITCMACSEIAGLFEGMFVQQAIDKLGKNKKN